MGGGRGCDERAAGSSLGLHAALARGACPRRRSAGSARMQPPRLPHPAAAMAGAAQAASPRFPVGARGLAAASARKGAVRPGGCSAPAPPRRRPPRPAPSPPLPAALEADRGWEGGLGPRRARVRSESRARLTRAWERRRRGRLASGSPSSPVSVLTHLSPTLGRERSNSPHGQSPTGLKRGIDQLTRNGHRISIIKSSYEVWEEEAGVSVLTFPLQSRNYCRCDISWIKRRDFGDFLHYFSGIFPRNSLNHQITFLFITGGGKKTKMLSYIQRLQNADQSHSQAMRKPAEQRKISAGIANDAFPHIMKGKQENRVFKWHPMQNKIIHPLWLKPWGTYRSKAANCQQAFHGTYSYIFMLHTLTFFSVWPYQRKMDKQIFKL
ncbi:uncharacterized protein LOC120584088 [Pteropus medius]|uniref:uncharacterized protein LOC120584088 n=1 Tax=Pteropus vampyrus TaxID=132908 RepID=UPI00196B7D62|nr:uncharacterized protein LOC120584088 [Pteropus giganteus]